MAPRSAHAQVVSLVSACVRGQSGCDRLASELADAIHAAFDANVTRNPRDGYTFRETFSIARFLNR